MLGQIFIVKPDSEFVTAHKPFTPVVELLIMSQIEIIDKSAGSYRPVNPGFLFLCRIYFRFETF